MWRTVDAERRPNDGATSDVTRTILTKRGNCCTPAEILNGEQVRPSFPPRPLVGHCTLVNKQDAPSIVRSVASLNVHTDLMPLLKVARP